MQKGSTSGRISLRDLARSDAVRGAIVVCLLAAAMLLFSSRVIDLSRIHVSGLDDALNDQVGYIGAARALAETGSLHSNVIYPSTLLQGAAKDYLYLPGHYVALAVSYKLFGYGVLQSLLPNLLSYVLAAVCVFLSGYKLYNLRTGMLAAFLFMLFPANVIYAGTAMSEMTRVATSILALTLFLYLSDGWKLLTGPFLLIIPFLFRETGALLVIPMGMLMTTLKGTRRWSKTGIFAIGALLVLVVVYRSDLSGGRVNLTNASVFDPSYSTVYTDAIANRALADKSSADWASRLPEKALHDLDSLVTNLVLHPQRGRLFEVASLGIILVGMLMALIAGVWFRDLYLFAAGSLTGAAVVLSLLFYVPDLQNDLRWLLFVFPFQAIVFARLYERLELRQFLPRLKWAGFALEAALLLVLIFVSSREIILTGQRVVANDARDDRYAACLERLSPNPNKLLVAPYDMAQYLYLHYPMRGAFVPANPATLHLLKTRYDIGLVIGRTTDGEHLQGSSLMAQDLQAAGLTLTEETNCGGDESYLVFSGGNQAYLIWRQKMGE